MTPAVAVEVGRRVFLSVSRRFLHPWIKPPADRAAFAAYLRRMRRPTERGFLVCRYPDGAIAGVINMSQIFYGGFRSAYLGFYAGAQFAGQGYMSEGLRLVGNRASIRLVRRCGFRREGFSPRYLKVFGRWRDHERWAITAEDLRR